MTTTILELKKHIKKMQGSVLGVNLQPDLVESLKQNKELLSCNLLEYQGINLFKGRNRKAKKGRSEQIVLKKIIKRFGKKSHTYVIGDIKTIQSHKKTFIKDSINLATKGVYLYIQEEYDETHLVAMFKRYTDVEIVPCNDGQLLKVTTENVKTNWLLDKVYYVVDIIWDGIDLISDTLVR